RLQLARDAADQPGGLGRSWLAFGAADEVGPGVAGGDVDRGQLTDRAAGAVQPADEEAVDADQFAGSLSLDVALRLQLPRRLVGGAVASDKREPLRARVEPMPTQAAPDAVRGNDQAAPAWAGKLSSDPTRSQAGVAQRKRDDRLLHKRGELDR